MILHNMFNCDKVRNNEVQGYSFFTPMSRSGAIFFALALLKVHVQSFGDQIVWEHHILVK